MNASVFEWVVKADQDYVSAMREHTRGAEANHELICFLCQQCVEKLIKAVLIQHRRDAPKIHNLVKLSELLVAAVPGWSADLDELNELTLGAVDYRYPGEVAEEIDSDKAFRIASKLLPRLKALLTDDQE